MESYLIPARRTNAERKAKNSRFIATIAPTHSRREAERFIDAIEGEYPDATHHVAAFVIGHGSSKITHANDDGEPPGSAGGPVLSVLEGSGLGDATVVVVRYFGGTKLGIGGLVRAYSTAAQRVLHKVKKAQKVPVHTVDLTTPYPHYQRIAHLVDTHHGLILDEEFTSHVKMSFHIPVAEYDPFHARLMELTSGAVSPRIVAKGRTAVLPYREGEPII